MTVCINTVAGINCGFTGASPSSAIPDWNITFRNDTGSVISSGIIGGVDILLLFINGLQWLPDLTNGINNSPNSQLLVGPVNMTHNQSSYQCMFTIFREGSLNTLMSSIGTMTVLGKMSYRHCNKASTNCIQQICHLLLLMWMKSALHQLTYH